MMSADTAITALRRRTVLAAVAAVIGLSGAANAFADADPVDLSVVDRDTGQPLRVWSHGGRLYVAGQPGRRYSLRVTNHTEGRVLVVLSVDGVNILTGQTAKYDQEGYVFSPYQSYDLSGWRKSTTEIAAFAFAPLPRSYAARTGRPTDVGVIGMAVFKERAQPPVSVAPAIRPEWRDEPDRDSSGAADSAAARRPAPAPRAALKAVPAPPSSEVVVTAQRRASAAEAQSRMASGLLARRQDEKLGTAHGAREWSVVNMVSFERATPYPQSVRQIEYDTFDNLVASGVIRLSSNTGHRPRPFPSNPDEAGFVPDPPDEP
jgi:hypothetical protein